MHKTISVGQLRQNPTEMVHDVRLVETYTLTDRGVPVADIAPHRPSRWIPLEEVAAVLNAVAPDPELAADIATLRAAETPRDPWAA